MSSSNAEPTASDPLLGPRKEDSSETPLKKFMRSAFLSASFIVGFILLSSFVYMSLEGWDLLESVYFCIITVTTVGYGDMAPDTEEAQLYTVLYILFGTTLVLNLISDGLSYILDKQEEYVVSLAMKNSHAEMQEDKHAAAEAAFWAKLNVVLPLSIGVVVLFLGVGTLFWMWDEEVSWATALYFSVVTISTVGYGDYAPQTPHAKLFAIMFVVLGVCTFGYVVSQMFDLYSDYQQLKTRGRVLSKTHWTAREMQKLDKDGDGQCSWGEYLEWAVVQAGEIDQCVLDEYYQDYLKDFKKGVSPRKRATAPRC